MRKGLADHDPTATDTFTSKFLQADPTTDNLPEDEAAYVIGTTAAALMSFLLVMTLHLDAFAGLQAELDTVVRHNRLPTSADIDPSAGPCHCQR